MESSSSHSTLTFYDFLDRMRNPASLDLVRSIKSFIVSFSFYAANPENDGKRLQDFLLTMEATIMDHPLWVGATEEEIDSAIEGLEKYVMTKLFSRTFAASPEDAKIDQEISEKVQSLQTFLRPEHLDIPPVLHNEASWLLAEKELQKINAFKAPREKLLCIMNCCRVINNLLLNASMSENLVLAGADDFLPVLIYVTIKANPPQLHSNLKFIQLYRRQEKLVSEVAYYFTNLVSAKSFIVGLDAGSLSMDETEFQKGMQAARMSHKVIQVEPSSSLDYVGTVVGKTNIDPSTKTPEKVTRMEPSPIRDEMATLREQVQCNPPTRICHEESSISGGSRYPFMEVEAGDLTVGDVERLLSLYKDVVTKYTGLCRTFRQYLPKLGDPALLTEPMFFKHSPEEMNANVNQEREQRNL
ncbi:vacuolar protein sorting-associated protein 9A-like isoform X1 [Malania oleifera]|uniref:vacuolar protein sorting-associated protein 9A-like isoform X1 n=1 Tax=Malania oleifera TaxID=397392 RepID=UPI0025AE1830|nr:vacuolar protein sorting-associated protein 9A-like isoform X1 [Malania oleifera]